MILLVILLKSRGKYTCTREVLLRSVCIYYYTVKFLFFFQFQVATVTDIARVNYRTPHIIGRLHSTDGSNNGPWF